MRKNKVFLRWLGVLGVMVGKRVDAGSYVYIPPGVAHAVDDVGPDGVEFFYTYRPVEVVEDPDNPLHEEHGAVA